MHWYFSRGEGQVSGAEACVRGALFWATLSGPQNWLLVVRKGEQAPGLPPKFAFIDLP